MSRTLQDKEWARSDWKIKTMKRNLVTVTGDPDLLRLASGDDGVMWAGYGTGVRPVAVHLTEK